jgi:hypothetical protein
VLIEGQRGVYLGAQAWLVEEGRELAWAERHIVRNPTIKYVLGRFVEADQANQNGHIFDAKELVESQKSIPNSPLNLLHRPHYIVGNYIAAELQYPTQGPTVTSSFQDQTNSTDMTVNASEAPANPYIEALAGFWRYYFPDEFQEVERAHKEGSLFFCVDEETELLSADGWKRHDELTEGQEILTLNRFSGLSEWLPLETVHRYDLDGEEVVQMESAMHSSVTTPNHRWWVERRPHRTRRDGSVWEWRTTDALTQETFIPRAVPHADFPVVPKYDDSFVELAAWFWTEGTVSGGSSVVYQSHTVNPQNCARIAACLTRLYGLPARVRDGGLWYSTDHGRMRHFHLSAVATRPFLEVGGKVPRPGFIRALTESQLRLWVQTSLDGDGDQAASGQVGIKQNNLTAQRTFEMACVLLGIPTNTRLCKDGQWRVGINQRSTRFNPVRDAQLARYKSRADGMHIERRAHYGVVWCPTTANGTFLARRNGSVYWTGNSMECVPKTVNCAAVCGQTYAYDGRQSPTYCDHLNQPGAKKRLGQPHFTGGALIMPPVKPGWNRADITHVSSLMAEHAREAEMAYDQTSKDLDHLDARQWEQMVAQLMGFAYREAEGEWARDFSTDQRKKLAGQGAARPDGSYPIVTPEDLGNAIKAFGRSNPGDRAAVKAHIVKRARALGKTSMLPEGWGSG